MTEIALDLPRHEAPRASRLGLAAVGALVLLALVEAGASIVGPMRVPSDADWAAAAAEVRAGFKPGDLIVFAPAWSDATGRLFLGDLIPPEMAARADASRYARIWEVSSRGAHAPETRESGTYPGSPQGSPSTHGRLRVTLYTRSQAVVPLFDFTAHAGEAHVTQTAPNDPSGAGGPDERTCAPSPEHGGASVGFQCASTRVERRILEVEFTPRAGILAPADGTRTTRIEFPEVPLGNSLVGYTGIHDWHSRKFGGGPVDFKVLVDGAQLLATRIENPGAWRSFVVPTLRYAGTSHAVRFEIASPAGASERRLGFHVESRSEAPPAATTDAPRGGQP